MLYIFHDLLLLDILHDVLLLDILHDVLLLDTLDIFDDLLLDIFLDDDLHVPRLRRLEGPDVGGLAVSLQGRGGAPGLDHGPPSSWVNILHKLQQKSSLLSRK